PNTTLQFPLTINKNVDYQGYFSSALTFESNDSLFSTKTIEVYGEVLPPLYLPDSLDMGVVPTIKSGTYEILVQNYGDQAITIESMESDIADTDPIEVIAELPKTLTPGENFTITLNFRPKSTASYAKTIQLITSDLINPEIKINGKSIEPLDSWVSICDKTGLCEETIFVGESYPFAMQFLNLLDYEITIDSITATGPFKVKQHGKQYIPANEYVFLDLFVWEPVIPGRNSGNIILHMGSYKKNIPVITRAYAPLTVEQNKIYGAKDHSFSENYSRYLAELGDNFILQKYIASNFAGDLMSMQCIDDKGQIYAIQNWGNNIGDLFILLGHHRYKKVDLSGMKVIGAAFNHTSNNLYLLSKEGGIYVKNENATNFAYLGKVLDSEISFVQRLTINPSNGHLVLCYLNGSQEIQHLIEFDPNTPSDHTFSRILGDSFPKLADIYYGKNNKLYGQSSGYIMYIEGESPVILSKLSWNTIIYSSNKIPIDADIFDADIDESVLMTSSVSEGIEIYPNPASKHLNLKLPGIDKDQEIEISFMDVAGRKVKDLHDGFIDQVDDHIVVSFSLDELKTPPGLYLLRVILGSQKPFIQKLVIE
ncbi:MAG: T9SS type A sorting domain-containing protein, partial [Marinoscillum sp.]